MQIGDRVRALSGREGVVQRLGEYGNRECAWVRFDSDTDADLPLEIPVNCLRVLPAAQRTGKAGGGA